VRQPEDDQCPGKQQCRDERLVVGFGRVLMTVVSQATGDAGGDRGAVRTCH